MRKTKISVFTLSILIIIFWAMFFKTALSEENSPKVLRVAILDNPNFSDNSWMLIHYENAYVEGIEAAALAAKNQAIRIEYKMFFYGKHPLDILKKIPEVKQWKPDLILGPHYSNQFLLLKKYFHDTLVLSSYATDSDISELPNNFYSIVPSDNMLALGLAKLYIKKFPNRRINTIIQLDCKACVDLEHLFLDSVLELNEDIVYTKTEFIGNNPNAIDLEKLTTKYKKGDVIFIETPNYSLISRIANFLEDPDVVFFTGLDSFDLKNLNVNTNHAHPVEYSVYRMSSLWDDFSDPRWKQFRKLFFEKHKKDPKDAVSYMTFLSVMSSITALEKFPVKQGLSMQEQVLDSFKKALQSDPNWFRPKEFGVYEYNNYSDKQGEILVDIIPAFESRGNTF